MPRASFTSTPKAPAGARPASPEQLESIAQRLVARVSKDKLLRTYHHDRQTPWQVRQIRQIEVAGAMLSVPAGIYRRVSGWQIMLPHKASQHFADSRHGGPDKSLAAARQARDRAVKEARSVLTLEGVRYELPRGVSRERGRGWRVSIGRATVRLSDSRRGGTHQTFELACKVAQGLAARRDQLVPPRVAVPTLTSYPSQADIAAIAARIPDEELSTARIFQAREAVRLVTTSEGIFPVPQSIRRRPQGWRAQGQPKLFRDLDYGGVRSALWVAASAVNEASCDQEQDSFRQARIGGEKYLMPPGMTRSRTQPAWALCAKKTRLLLRDDEQGGTSRAFKLALDVLALLRYRALQLRLYPGLRTAFPPLPPAPVKGRGRPGREPLPELLVSSAEQRSAASSLSRVALVQGVAFPVPDGVRRREVGWSVQFARQVSHQAHHFADSAYGGPAAALAAAVAELAERAQAQQFRADKQPKRAPRQVSVLGQAYALPEGVTCPRRGGREQPAAWRVDVGELRWVYRFSNYASVQAALDAAVAANETLRQLRTSFLALGQAGALI